MFLVSSCSLSLANPLKPGVNREWRCSWSSADSTFSEWPTILLSIKMWLILEVWRYITPITHWLFSKCSCYFFPTYSLNGKVLKFWVVSYKQSLWTSRNSLWPDNLTTKVDFSLVRFWCNSPDSNFTFSIEDTMLVRDEIEKLQF